MSLGVHVSQTNHGLVVICDFCNEGEDTMGGVLIGSYAICGDCCETHDYRNPEHLNADEIDEIWDIEKSFHDNVLDYRERVYGTKELITEIISLEAVKKG
jgi:hypothetical protein